MEVGSIFGIFILIIGLVSILIPSFIINKGESTWIHYVMLIFGIFTLIAGVVIIYLNNTIKNLSGDTSYSNTGYDY